MALASLFAALFLTTPFSFTGTHALVRGPVKKLDPIGRLKARWSAWQEKREQERMRKRVEANKLSGRQPVPTQTMGSKERKAAAEAAEAAEEERSKAAEDDDTAVARPVFMPEIAEAPAAAKRSSAEPKIARGAASFRLPSPSLLRVAERSEKISGRRTEGVRAGHRGEVPRIRRRRARHADQPRPGGHDLRVQAGSGHQVQPHHRALRRFVPGAAGRIDSDRAHSGQIDGGHRSAQPAAGRRLCCAK